VRLAVHPRLLLRPWVVLLRLRLLPLMMMLPCLVLLVLQLRRPVGDGGRGFT